MRVAIDGRSLLGYRTGIGNYTFQLLRRFPRLAPQDEFMVLTHLPASAEELGLDQRIGVAAPGWRCLKWWFGWSQAYLPVAARKAGADLIFSPGTGAPYFPLLPLVVTIHDLAPLRFPHYFTRRAARYWHWVIPRNARRADAILTLSEFTKADVVDRLGVDPRRVHVTYPGADERFSVSHDVAMVREVCRRYGLEPGYILYVGTVGPRKNLPRLFQAIRLLKDRGHLLPPVVVAGWRGWLWEDSLRSVAELGLDDHVRWLGYVSDNDLPCLYAGAQVFVYVSQFEGFGLPPLEAMASGVPVVASQVSSLPEVVGDAGLLVDPDSTEEIAEAVWRILADHALQQELRAKGLARASRFSWRQTARHTLEIFAEVASSGLGHTVRHPVGAQRG